ncbi:hypothetical protein EVAR_37633_1 [Eumeta japonica]|uniref:Uncharacterized protein n=1 Tax=Eumeta variegata TaxID=151549 RepID=A0A4C1VP96_EUMVA|nr:hypothetical protein EVAR_37633_1 [Eumeta japonica]
MFIYVMKREVLTNGRPTYEPGMNLPESEIRGISELIALLSFSFRRVFQLTAIFLTCARRLTSRRNKPSGIGAIGMEDTQSWCRLLIYNLFILMATLGKQRRSRVPGLARQCYRYHHCSRVSCVRALSLFYSAAPADGVEERSLVPRSRSRARLRRNATMSHAFSCVQPAFIDL